jgi:hypothetical protein
MTVWPIETWPSPATITFPFMRTDMMVVPCQTGMALERWSFMARHMGANGLPRKHSSPRRWIVAFSRRNYDNSFRNQFRLIDFVRSSTDHEDW